MANTRATFALMAVLALVGVNCGRDEVQPVTQQAAEQQDTRYLSMPSLNWRISYLVNNEQPTASIGIVIPRSSEREGFDMIWTPHYEPGVQTWEFAHFDSVGWVANPESSVARLYSNIVADSSLAEQIQDDYAFVLASVDSSLNLNERIQQDIDKVHKN